MADSDKFSTLILSKTHVDIAQMTGINPERIDPFCSPKSRRLVSAGCREVSSSRSPLDVPDRMLMTSVSD